MTLNEVLKEIEKVSGKGAVMVGVEVKDVERIPFPAVGVSRMLYGGFPKGRMVEFYGPESGGKSSSALLLVVGYQQQDTRPVFWIDADGTFDPRWAAFLGVDNSPERFIKWQPENVTAEEVFEMILKVATTDEVGLIVLDDIPSLVPQQEEAKKMTEYQMGGISKPLTQFTKKLQKVLLKNDTLIFVGINQVRDNMTGYGPTENTVGGHAWKHACSIRLNFRSEYADKNGKHMSDAADSPAYVRINVALKKNKTAPRDRKLSYYFIDFETGFNAKQDLVMAAIATEVIKQSGSQFAYIDENGEILFKAQGRAKFIETVPDAIYELLREEVLKDGN